MAFLRFSRDKRGYEHFYLVQPTTNRRGKVRTRVLYWFRTPPNMKVGREPFDETLRRAIEAQNPGVSFDWPKIVATPIPSGDTEKWRERRRLDRAERAARLSESEEEETPAAVLEASTATPELSAEGELPTASALSVTEDTEIAEIREDAADEPVGESQERVEARSAQPADQPRRRRRRGRRGRSIGSSESSGPKEPQ